MKFSPVIYYHKQKLYLSTFWLMMLYFKMVCQNQKMYIIDTPGGPLHLIIWYTWKTDINHIKAPNFNFENLKTELKNHTHMKVVANLRISFWHLLMNLKNKLIIKKLLKWASKKQNNFNIYNVALKKKKKKKTIK